MSDSFPKLLKDHGYLILGATGMCLYAYISGLIYVGPTRSKTFGKEWSESEPVKAIKDEHAKEVKDAKFSESGYPDMGNGRYAATLPYKKWYEFANAQRAHYKVVETFAPTLGLSLLAGVYYPKASAGLSVIWIVSQHVWATNYQAGGAESRYASIAGLGGISLLGWLGLSTAGGLKLLGVPVGF